MNKADQIAKVIKLCKGKFAEVIVSEQEKADANSKTLKYNNFLENIHEVWRLEHASKSNDNNDKFVLDKGRY